MAALAGGLFDRDPPECARMARIDQGRVGPKARLASSPAITATSSLFVSRSPTL